MFHSSPLLHSVSSSSLQLGFVFRRHCGGLSWFISYCHRELIMAALRFCVFSKRHRNKSIVTKLIQLSFPVSQVWSNPSEFVYENTHLVDVPTVLHAGEYFIATIFSMKTNRLFGLFASPGEHM